MKTFQGFPARMTFTPIPNLFINQLMPDISDIAELKVTIHIMEMLYSKRGYPRFVTSGELLGNAGLMTSLKSPGTTAAEVLKGALEKAVKRETLIHLVKDENGKREDVYFLNTQTDRQAVTRIKSGELKLPGQKALVETPAATEKPSNIFALYEDNIGLLTPMAAEELKEAEKLYPASWIQDAIKEAVSLNKRSIRYITRILERWSAEGRGDGTYRRDFEEDDPDKYIKGKYGHMVQR